MKYTQLRIAMLKKDITIKDISELLDLHRNSVSNKINGDARFSIEEAQKIRDTFFKKEPLEKLFQIDDSC